MRAKGANAAATIRTMVVVPSTTLPKQHNVAWELGAQSCHITGPQCVEVANDDLRQHSLDLRHIAHERNECHVRPAATKRHPASHWPLHEHNSLLPALV